MTPRSTLKTAVLAPMPSARVRTTAAAKPGDLARERRASRMGSPESDTSSRRAGGGPQAPETSTEATTLLDGSSPVYPFVERAEGKSTASPLNSLRISCKRLASVVWSINDRDRVNFDQVVGGQ